MKHLLDKETYSPKMVLSGDLQYVTYIFALTCLNVIFHVPLFLMLTSNIFLTIMSNVNVQHSNCPHPEKK
jgi:hypothetical protein